MTADEQRFSGIIEGGEGADLLAVAGRLAGSATPMPVTTAAMLNLPDGATFTHGAAYVLARSGAGLAPF